MCLLGTTEGLTERKAVLPAQEGVYSELAQGEFLFPHYLYLVEIGFHRILVTGGESRSCRWGCESLNLGMGVIYMERQDRAHSSSSVSR